MNHKALKAADHFLLSRYFDNQQAAFHKTVVGFEWLLKGALEGLLEHGLIECDVSAIRKKMNDQTWLQFNDDHVTHKMHAMLEDNKDVDEITGLMTSSLLKRHPPKQLIEFEEIADQKIDPFEDKKKLVNNIVNQLAEKHGIDKRLWHIWTQRVSPTKVGASFGIDEIDDINQDKTEQLIQVFDHHEKKPRPIVTMLESLMSVLSNYKYNVLRLYLLLPPEKESLFEEIKREVYKELH